MMIFQILRIVFLYFIVDFFILFKLVFEMELGFSSLQRCDVTDPVWKWSNVCFFLYEIMCTTFIIFAIILNSLRYFLLEMTERLFSNFLFAEIISDLLLNQFSNIFISFGKIFVKFINNHSSKLLTLLDGLSLLNC